MGSGSRAPSDDGECEPATLDGRDEDGVSPEGVFPPGDDLVERDLKRIFSIDDDEDGASGPSGLSDLDEVQVRRHSLRLHGERRAAVTPHRAICSRARQLMWKLRQELGDDFNRIFDDPKIRGADIN